MQREPLSLTFLCIHAFIVLILFILFYFKHNLTNNMVVNPNSLKLNFYNYSSRIIKEYKIKVQNTIDCEDVREEGEA